MTSEFPMPSDDVADTFRRGTVVPAHPLALTEKRTLDERHQRALTRYYLDAGAGGLAVGVHTTEFKIHDPKVGLYAPVLKLAAQTARDWRPDPKPVLIAGICGPTDQALREADMARQLGYHIGMISLAALPNANDDQLIEHARTIAQIMPIMGFYLQPAAGGRILSESFWRRLAEVPNLVGIKIAPFNRYHTLAVVRAIAESGRAEKIDDAIVVDLLTTYRFGEVTVGIVGGLLGHWAFWTHRAVELLDQTRRLRTAQTVPTKMLTLAAQVTEANEAVFDPQNDFKGCLSGILYVLSTTGLVQAVRTLDPREALSPGQAHRIDRIIRDYRHVTDDDFVKPRINRWLRP